MLCMCVNFWTCAPARVTLALVQTCVAFPHAACVLLVSACSVLLSIAMHVVFLQSMC